MFISHLVLAIVHALEGILPWSVKVLKYILITCNHVILQMEAKLVLSRLVQSYHVTLPDGYKLDIVERITRQPRDDIMCTLLPRK